MSEEGADQGRDDKSAFKKLYNVKEFSDVKLFIPGLGKLGPSRSIIYAHKVILAAGSEFLRSEFLRPSSTKGLAAALIMDDFDTLATYNGVRYLYGFDLTADYGPWEPTLLEDFLELCVVAVHYKIDGLLESTVKATIRALTDSFSYESIAKDHLGLKEFLGERLVIPDDDRYHPHLHSILGGHLTKLYTYPHFQDLLNGEPVLARILLDGFVKGQALRESSALTLR